MPVSKPTKLPDWATSATGIAATTEPSSGKKADGWAVSEAPPAQEFNWWFNLVGAWVDWLNDLVNQALVWTAQPTFNAGVKFSDGSVQTKAARSPIVQTGVAQHLDAVTFPVAFNATPVVVITGGLHEELGNHWGATGDGTETGAPLAATNTYEDTAPLSVTTTGFTVRARLKQKGGGTITAESIGSPHTVDTGTDTAPNLGATSASSALTPAPAVSDLYTLHYSGSVTINSGTGAGSKAAEAALVLAIEAAVDGTTWVEVASRQTYLSDIGAGGGTHAEPFTGSIAVTVPGMLDTQAKMRIRVVSFDITMDLSLNGDASASYSASLPASAAVTYNASTTPDQYASKTPDADDVVAWTAIGL